MQQHRQVLPRQHQRLRPRQSSNGILWDDILVQPSSLTQCGNITLSWSGGVAPYTLVGNWWESSSGYSDSIARQWVIAQGLPDTTHLFTGMFSDLLVVEAPSDYSRSSCVSRMQPMYRLMHRFPSSLSTARPATRLHADSKSTIAHLLMMVTASTSILKL